MSKVASIIISGLFVLIALILNTGHLSALDDCPMRTDPHQLLDSERKATFTVNVERYKGYSAYKMEFDCGLQHHEETVTANSASEISTTLDSTGVIGLPPCEFTQGKNKTIKVKVGDSLQCIATYEVKKVTPQCKLNIDPSSGITSATPLTVNVEGLHAVEYKLLIDNHEIKGGYVTSADFSASVPQKYMTPGPHIIELKPSSNLTDSAECSIPFKVGTPEEPGSVSSPGAVPTSQKCKNRDDKSFDKDRDIPCTSASGIQCNTADPKNPAISTAIGCVHTSPVGFVTDLLKFLVAISGGLAFLMMLLGAFQMLTSAGNPETLQAGRDRFTSAIIGLLFVIFAVLLLKIIGLDILTIPGFGK